MVPRATSTAILLACIATACGGGRTVVVTPRTPVTPGLMAQLHVDPGTQPRDLFWGVGGQDHAPPPDAIYTLKAKDESGFSVSYDVIGPGGLEWSAKIGPEAQTEVVLSRLLWGLGYQQPPVYYLATWRLSTGRGDPIVMSEARFRPKLSNLVRNDGDWIWADNPFNGTPELRGLLVVLLMLNSTDLKDSNNTIYTPMPPWDTVPRWYVVRDLGAALGETGKLYPKRNWLEGFEREPFITAVRGSTIEFAYDGRHKNLLAMIRPGDLQWAARQMERLTDEQWRDAFRASNYPTPIAERYVRRIKEKVADGLAVRVDRRTNDD
jgi:hypothetical protein